MTTDVATFLAARRRVRVARSALTHEQLATAAPDRRVGTQHALAPAGWLTAPRPLATVRLQGDHGAVGDLEPARAIARRSLPTEPRGEAFRGYHEAVAALDAGSPVRDLPCYRLLEVDVRDAEAPTLRFGRCTYVDAIDTTEVLGYEAALGAHGYRSWLGDPVAFARRAAVAGVITLTIVAGVEPTMLIHRRGAVTIGPGTVHVVPAGELQPVDDTPGSYDACLDLWTNICREYAEEVAGHDEVLGAGLHAPDRSTEPYRSLQAARDEGRLTAWYLGVAVDPLTWKPDVLTACVIERDTFAATFPHVGGDEGTIERLPFDRQVIADHLARHPVLATGRALLDLADRHRDRLLAGR